MKRLPAMLLALVCALILASCSGRAETPVASDAASPEAPPSAELPVSPPVDVDLTQLSPTMVYSEVNDMVTHPDDYLGKTVRMRGMCVVFEGEGRTYYSCIIADATACCAQGIEFILADSGAVYPDQGDDITVEGVFDTYYEAESMYCQLIEAALTARR